MSLLKFVFILLEVLLLFNLLIFVHELGHFLAARWRGLKVDRFAIWFGKPLWKKNINGVEYVLGCIPAGGYVSLPQMATMEAIEGKADTAAETLPPVSAWDKILVAFAGPLFSFLLALAFAVVVMFVGRPVSESETTTVIGYVEKDGPAEKAGLRPGDRILAVDGQPVSKFGGMGDSVTWRVVRSEGARISVKVERNGQVLEFQPEPAREPTKIWQRQSLRQIRILPAMSSIIAVVITNSPAAVAGLRPGDRILSVNGQPLFHFAALGEYVEQHSAEALTLEVQRGSARFSVSVRPEKPISPPDEKPRLGIIWNASGDTRLAYPGAVEQVRASVMVMVDTFEALFASKSDIKPQHLGGAVKIMDVYYRLFDSEQGWRLAIWFSVLMNVNLALLNLLPIPVLDGGHILLAIIEGIRRRPISMRLINAIQTTCAVLLIGFMVYLAFYDVQELPWKRSKEKLPELKFAPKPPTAP
ncbi:MAG TPA: RIP metalloprotease RseP [Candidatus Paceibacterota bacterium]|nr:RIP metalloprotease RseP [Candidatus Paceibacterota bacterium]